MSGPFINIPTPQGHTEVISYSSFVAGLFKYDPVAINMKLHAAVGIAGEAGELIDAVKKTWVYGKPLDEVNVAEELGDLLFYIQALANLQQISIQEILQGNADKLAKRYVGLKYSDEAAIERADKVGTNGNGET
jgi:phosphoribosyl-ATP pyrophosphohydrolase